VLDPIDWVHSADERVWFFGSPMLMRHLYKAHREKLPHHGSAQDMLIHVHEDQKPVPLTLPYLKLCQKIRQEQPGWTCVQSVCLDMVYLLLIYRLKPFWRLPAYIVRRDNPSSVSRIAVEEGGAPSAQTSKVIALLLHVSDQFPTCKSGRSPRLIVGDTLMPVVHRMCSDVRNVVTKPGGQVCRN